MRTRTLIHMLTLCGILPAILLFTQCRTSRDTAILQTAPTHRNGYVTDRTDRDFVDFLNRYVEASVKRHGFSGVVLFARGDDILFHRAYGLAERIQRVPVSIDTRFNLASASKMFTAVAVAKLEERGKLSFDDPIAPLSCFPTSMIPPFPS